ncbi:thermonuclease family protein [Endothiovibrio diazotrophicus]
MRRLLPLLLIAPPLLAGPLHQWRDERGILHLEGAGAPPTVSPSPSPSPAPAEGRVVAVPDGDTVYLQGGMKLRLIGINAPEVAHHNRPGEPGGEAAGSFLRERLMGRQVRLEPGLEPFDHYGRLLVHLYDGSGVSINELLLREGHAWVSPHPPNLRHIERYAAAEAEARAAHRGLWADPRYDVIDASDAGDFRNSFRRLRGRVSAVEWRGDTLRLHLDEAVALQFDAAAVTRFRTADRDPEALRGHRLVVRGRLGGQRGLPTLWLHHPVQIEEID